MTVVCFSDVLFFASVEALKSIPIDRWDGSTTGLASIDSGETGQFDALRHPCLNIVKSFDILFLKQFDWTGVNVLLAYFGFKFDLRVHNENNRKKYPFDLKIKI